MPRKIGRVITEIDGEAQSAADIPAAATPPLSAVGEETEVSLRAFIASFGSVPAKVTVYKFDRSGNEVYCGAGLPGVVDEEWLQTTYGAGRYVVRLTDDRGKYLRSRTIYVAAGAEPDAAYQGIAAATPVPVVAPVGQPFTPQPQPVQHNGNGSDVEALRAEMSGLRDMMMRLIERAMETPRNTGSSLAELTAAITTLKEITQPAPAGSQIGELINVLKTGIELGQNGATVPDNKPAWMQALTSVAESVAPALAGLVSRRPAAPAPAQPGAVPPPMQQPAQPQPQDNHLALLMRGINYLKPKARQGKDYNLYVDFVAGNLEDTEWLPFLDLLQRPYEDIAKIDPDLLTPLYRPWFEGFFTELRNALTTPDNGGPGGNDPDDAHDAPTGA